MLGIGIGLAETLAYREDLAAPRGRAIVGDEDGQAEPHDQAGEALHERGGLGTLAHREGLCAHDEGERGEGEREGDDDAEDPDEVERLVWVRGRVRVRGRGRGRGRGGVRVRARVRGWG